MSSEPRRRGWRWPALLLFALFWLTSASGVVADSERPKIGLALSGGGAKGGAHVGVLKVLEELRVPVDYIAGTSMGAVIGGLYASGVPAEELEKTLLEIDWEDVLDDKPNRADLHFRRKEDDARYLLDLELGIGRGGLRWPAGLLTGQKLYFLLQSLTLPVAEISDFDRLPIPFRCVATDIQSGEMVVLSEGNLASALRASMAIPTVFSPVQLGDGLLVDGGVTRNLPVDVVREMGADVVVAVDLGAELTTRDVESLVAIYQQLSRIQIRSNVEPQLEAADLVIKPPVTSFGTMKFSEIETIVKLGYESAREKAAELETLAVPAAEYRGPVVAQRVDATSRTLLDVRFEGNQRVDDRVVRNRLRLEPGQPLDLDEVGAELGRIYGLGDFESVTFDVERAEQGSNLVLNLKEKPWGPNFLHFGFSFSSDFAGDTEVGLLGNVTATRLNALGAEWRTDLLVGSDSLIFSELYQPLDFRGRWFVAPYIEVERLRSDFYEEGRRLAELQTRLGWVGLDIGYEAGKFGEFRLGYERGRASVSVESGELPPPTLEEVELDNVDVAGARFRVTTDRLDSASFPRSGHRFRMKSFFSRESMGADRDYDRWEATLGKFWSFGPNTIAASVDGGWSPGSELPEYAKFRVGGFLSLSGFAKEQLRGQYYGVARLAYYRDAFGLYLGGFVEGGNVWQSSDEVDIDSLLGAATVFVGMDSRLGPVYLAYGQAEGGNGSVYLVFGRTF